MLWLAQSNPTGVLPAYRKRTRTLVASNSQMSKIPVLFTCVASAAFALPALAFAQYGGQGLGSALGSDPLSHQGQERPGAEANAAVAPMSSMLFLRSTEQIAKLHLVAELGRIATRKARCPSCSFWRSQKTNAGAGLRYLRWARLEMRKRRHFSKGSRWKIRVRRYGGWREKRCARSAATFFASIKNSWLRRKIRMPRFRPIKLAKLRALDQESQNQER
jgi:hypothetical protein